MQISYDRKPFLGILVMIGEYKYFLPLTSSKPKHSKWKNVGSAHYLIYEQVDKTELTRRDVFKSISPTEALKLFAALDIKKMIPVPEGLYSRVDFAARNPELFISCTVTSPSWKMPARNI